MMPHAKGAPARRVLLPAFAVPLSSALAMAPPAIVATITLAIIVAILPGPLICPLASPLVPPSRRPLAIPLLPVSGRHGIVPHWHRQEGPGHKLGTDKDPRTVVVTADMPAVIGEGPILPAIEEDVCPVTQAMRPRSHDGAGRTEGGDASGSWSRA